MLREGSIGERSNTGWVEPTEGRNRLLKERCERSHGCVALYLDRTKAGADRVQYCLMVSVTLAKHWVLGAWAFEHLASGKESEYSWEQHVQAPKRSKSNPSSEP